MLAGVAVSWTHGEGAFAQDAPCTGASCAGDLESSVIGAYPYMRFQVNRRLSAWAMLGYGGGELTVDLRGTGPTIQTDVGMWMGALGASGILLPASPKGGFGLALESDALYMGTSSDRTEKLDATEADAYRLRLALVGSRRFDFAKAGAVTPSAELGLRHDGGDAENGSGVELGAAISYAHRASGLTAEARIRALAAHEDDDYREWSASGTVRLNPGPSGRGLSFAIAPSWGTAPARASGPRSLDNAGRRGAGPHPAASLDAEMSYGFAVLDGGGVLTPFAGLSMGRSQGRTWRHGWRLELGPAARFDCEAVRRRGVDGEAPEDRFMLRASLRR